jgi:hypothetical protein
MFSFALMPICGLILYVLIGIGGDARKRIQVLLLAAFLARMVLQYVVRSLSFFTGGFVGGDSSTYDLLAQYISHLWERNGFFFVTNDDLWGIGSASLPVNMFAMVTYLNGGQALEGCTAIVAFAACLTGYNFYKLACDLGASEKAAYWLTAGLMFSPAFLLYSSDGYKDALVLMFQFGATASAVRLSRKVSLLHTLVGALCLWCLWYVRSYLVFASLIPLGVGLVGINSKSAARPLFLIAVAISGVIVVGFGSNALATFGDKANDAFVLGTSTNVRDSAALGGSGVLFDDGGSVYGALHLKILYTLFAPFIWQTGSFGLQVGKIDSLLTTYVFYRAYKTCRRDWNEHRATILTLFSFAFPMTIAYALGMSNVGLILRQRIPIVVVVMVVAALGFKGEPQRAASAKESERAKSLRRPPRLLRTARAAKAATLRS